MDFALSPELEALRDEALKVGREASERSDLPDDSWIVGHDRAFAQELGARGWLGMTWPVEHGGGGRSPLERFVVFEVLISTGAPIAASWFADRQMGPSLLQFGTDEQRARWLPGIIAGTSMWCIGMSEPDAGSNVAGIRTRAERDGDDWVVNGQKIWTSGAADADWCYLIARLSSTRRLYDDVRPLADTGDPLVRQEIAAIESGYRIGRLLVLRETLGQAPRQFSAATKTFCTELEQRIAAFCGRVLGPRAMLAEPDLALRVSRNLCYAPAYTIMGGTSQILRNILGERTLGLPREPR